VSIFVNEIGDDVARFERGLEDFAREEAPIAGNGESFTFESIEI
jgi:hypothetical protein